MEYTEKTWNEDFKILRNLLKRESTFQQAIDLFMDVHARVHASNVSRADYVTFEDEIWDGLDETTFRTGQNKKGRTVAYGMWHSARIEDITMNLLVADNDQVIDQSGWMEKINSTIYDTGNALDADQILAFSKTIDMQALRDYRNAVAQKTRNIVRLLTFSSLKTIASKSGLEKAVFLGAVVNHEDALWLIDYWKKKTAAGILLMPATRHHLVHINESKDAKKRGLRAL